MVVIGIIAILASLLLPALARAKASAHSVKCKSNLHQIGLGLRMYLDDEGYYPRVSEYAPWGTQGIPDPFATWALCINNYLNQPVARWQDLSLVEQQKTKNDFWPHPRGVFICPSDKRQHYGMGGSYGYNSVGISLKTLLGKESVGLGGHGLPCATGRFGLDRFYEYPTRESDVQVPSRMIAVGDGFIGSNDGLSRRPFDAYESSGEFARGGLGLLFSVQNPPTGRKRHQGRLTVLFCDGHVQGVRIETLFLSRNEEDMRIWNIDHESHRERLVESPGAMR